MNKKKASSGVFVADTSPWPKGQERARSFRFYLSLLKYQKLKKYIFFLLKKRERKDFPGGAVVKNPPANAGDTGSIPGQGRSHMPLSN